MVSRVIYGNVSNVISPSILGPTSFNDIFNYTRFSNLVFYADDTKCYKTISQPTDTCVLQEDLHSLTSWSSLNHIHFNPIKSVLVCFHSKSLLNHPHCFLTTPSETYRDLGVVISSDLIWCAHHNRIIAEAYRSLSLICRTFQHTNTISAKKLLYLSLVRSKLSYCSQVWRPYLLKDISQIERVQR